MPLAFPPGLTQIKVMVRLRNRYQCPVNGFQFVDAPISPDVISSWDFNDIVSKVIARREANPRFGLTVDRNAVAQEVDFQNAMRMLSIQNAESYIVNEGSPPPNFRLPRSRNLAGAVGAVKAGGSLLLEWLGEGGIPVDNGRAVQRASVCAGCPQNGKGDWLARFTQPAQDFIRGQMSIRKDLNLTTPFDDKLEICEACSCPLKLKVHAPLKHILNHLTADSKVRLDSRCWILSEQAS